MTTRAEEVAMILDAAAQKGMSVTVIKLGDMEIQLQPARPVPVAVDPDNLPEMPKKPRNINMEILAAAKRFVEEENRALLGTPVQRPGPDPMMNEDN
jgi:hypothetical protein